MSLTFGCSRFITAAQLLANDACACDVVLPEDLEEVDDVIDMACDMVAILSGGRVRGVCTRTVRPVGDGGCWPSDPSWDSAPDWLVGTIPLPGPNTDVVEVLIDGVPLSPSEYGLINNTYLKRWSGSWPSTNDLSLDETNVNTFAVTVRTGRPGDRLTIDAVRELACRLLQPDSGLFPPGVTSASIQGASISIEDAAEVARNADNLPAVARFLGIYAPDGPNVSAVYSPELSLGWTLIEREGGSGS